jgi:hypothetical protein
MGSAPPLVKDKTSFRFFEHKPFYLNSSGLVKKINSRQRSDVSPQYPPGRTGFSHGKIQQKTL